jgi:predicted transcriptional regulator
MGVCLLGVLAWCVGLVLLLLVRRSIIVAKAHYERNLMKTIALKLSDELLVKIEHAANKRGQTRSALMRGLLEEFFAEQAGVTAGSCLDLARDLAGCVQGPPDLSANPAHLDDYGR